MFSSKMPIINTQTKAGSPIPASLNVTNLPHEDAHTEKQYDAGHNTLQSTLQHPFVLLDRDGTIIAEKNYLSDPAGVEILPGAAEGLKLLQQHGFGLVVVTNQSGIGRGYYSVQEMHAVNNRMATLLAESGIALDGIYYCPHVPEEKCDCRKPRPGMVLRAAAELGFIPAHAVVIGDKAADLGLARAVGALGVLVRTGYGAMQESKLDTPPDMIADNLYDAAVYILKKYGIQGKL